MLGRQVPKHKPCSASGMAVKKAPTQFPPVTANAQVNILRVWNGAVTFQRSSVSSSAALPFSTMRTWPDTPRWKASVLQGVWFSPSPSGTASAPSRRPTRDGARTGVAQEPCTLLRNSERALPVRVFAHSPGRFMTEESVHGCGLGVRFPHRVWIQRAKKKFKGHA